MTQRVRSARRRPSAITLATWLLVTQGIILLLLGGVLLLPLVLRDAGDLVLNGHAMEIAIDGGVLVALGVLMLVVGMGLFFQRIWSWLLAMTMQGVNLAVALASYYRGSRDATIFLSMTLGLLLVMVGLGFKIAAFPFQIWAPDVYQGAPSPTTAFLAVGSKAAGFVLLLRVLFIAVPDITAQWSTLLMAISAITILYGNLCAIPQRNLKRLFGYSSIAHAGYMLLGIAALSAAGQAAVLYYLSGYLFTVLGAFTVICLVMTQVEGEDITSLAGLNQRAPLLAVTMTLAMVSLGGIPPLAGFFGKFLLFKAAIARGADQPAYYWLVAIAIAGVIISLYYYFGVVRAIFWGKEGPPTPIRTSIPIRVCLYGCITGMLALGLFPNWLVDLTGQAVKALH